MNGQSIPRDVPIGLLTDDGRLFFPRVPESTEARMLWRAGWRWDARLACWCGNGQPPVAFTRQAARS